MSATTTEAVTTTELSTAPTPGETPETEQPFDKERAMATIAKLREHEKRAKQLERELAELKANEDKAKEDALAEQAQFKQLADKRADKILELQAQVKQAETLQAERDRYVNVVEELAKQKRDGLDPAIVELLEGKDPVEQLEWLTKHPELTSGTTAGNGRTSGIGSIPKPAGNLSREELLKQEVAAQRERMR